MISMTPQYKKYHSATERFLKPMMKRFFKQQLPNMFGPTMLEFIATHLITLVESLVVPARSLRPGQMLWCAVDKRTRPDSPQCRLVPVVLTVITEEDCRRLSQGVKMTRIREDAIGRMCEEAYRQGALLSMRDLAAVTLHTDSGITTDRQAYERRTNTVLPHTGTLQDMGSCISHKAMIVRKAVYENKDPRTVARETHHTQAAVDRYLKDFQRVKLCHEKHFSTEEISCSTGIAKHVVMQYIELINAAPAP